MKELVDMLALLDITRTDLDGSDSEVAARVTTAYRRQCTINHPNEDTSKPT